MVDRWGDAGALLTRSHQGSFLCVLNEFAEAKVFHEERSNGKHFQNVSFEDRFKGQTQQSQA